MVRSIETSGPVIIGFDHTPASERAVHEAAVLLAPRPALVVVVWRAGLAFEAASTPALEAPPVADDVPRAMAVDRSLHDAAQQLAQRGAAVAVAAGMPATGVAVPDDGTVAETLIRIAEEQAAAAIAVGAHTRRGLRKMMLGSTAKDLLERAPCPVIVVTAVDPDHTT
jgi:nucleotide-binding universal stress UspA family protein